jgi:ADP-ribose pyrophosphatase
MAASSRAADLVDRPVTVKLAPPKLLADGFRRLERFEFELAMPGAAPLKCTRDILRVRQVVAVLPLDLARNEMVVLRQFRLAAHLAKGRGSLIEIVAGHVEANERPVDAARRETIEEIGVEPHKLTELFSCLPTPGMSDEEITFFLGLIDAAKAPARAGVASEAEDTEPIAVTIDEALAALERRTLHNGPLIMALQWLALHRARLPDIIAGS